MPTKVQLAESARNYVQALTDELRTRADRDADLRPFVDALLVCPTNTCRTEPRERLTHPSMHHLAQLCDSLGSATELTRHARMAADELDWAPVFAGGGIDPSIANGLLAAQAVGTYGCFANDRLAVGMFVVAPGVHYPLHTHAAAEIYFVLAGSIQIQHGIDGAPFTVGAGDYSVTPHHRLHVLETHDEPALIAYVWNGDLRCRNWWWSQEADGSWLRTAWERPVAGPWRPLETEAVNSAIMAEALGLPD